MHRSYDPLCYPLLFPEGTDGYTIDIPFAERPQPAEMGAARRRGRGQVSGQPIQPAPTDNDAGQTDGECVCSSATTPLCPQLFQIMFCGSVAKF